MNSRPSIFLLQTLFVAFLVLAHGVAAVLAWRRVARMRHRAGRQFAPASRRWLAGLLVFAVLLLDLPMFHLFVLYKFYHPLVLDQLMHGWAVPFITMHVNAALFGGLVITRDLLMPAIKRLRMRIGRVVGSRTRVPDGGPAIAVPAAAANTSSAGSLIAEPPIPSRRAFIVRSSLAVAGLAASAGTISAMGSTDEYRTEQAVIHIPGLPEALRGTTIALISDIHSSVFMMRDEMERYVTALNAMKADVAIVAGDFVNSKLSEVYPFAEAFSRLKAPMGVYGVTGNHDYYTGQIEDVAREVSQAGIRLLRGENIPIEKNGQRLWLLGMDDADIYHVREYLDNGKTEHGAIENMLRGIPDGDKRVFLCHKPYPFEEYSMLGMDLMLSGHTHGGQVVLAQLDNVNLSFASLASGYVAGLYRARSNRRSQLYVSRGVGTVGLPIRVNCPPEITRIVLV